MKRDTTSGSRSPAASCIAFGNPYVLRDVPTIHTYLCAYGFQPVLQTAAARAIFGEAPITGRLLITLTGLHAIGTGIQKAVREVR